MQVSYEDGTAVFYEHGELSMTSPTLFYFKIVIEIKRMIKFKT